MNYKPLIFLGIPLVMYLAQSLLVYAPQGRYGMTVAFLGYVIGNIGLALDAYGY